MFHVAQRLEHLLTQSSERRLKVRSRNINLEVNCLHDILLIYLLGENTSNASDAITKSVSVLLRFTVAASDTWLSHARRFGLFCTGWFTWIIAIRQSFVEFASLSSANGCWCGVIGGEKLPSKLFLLTDEDCEEE